MLGQVFLERAPAVVSKTAELPTLTDSSCDTIFVLFTHAHTPHIQIIMAKICINKIRSPAETRSFLSNSPMVDGAHERH